MENSGNVLDLDWALKLAELRFGTTGILNQKPVNLTAQKADFLAGRREELDFDFGHIRRPKFAILKEKYQLFLNEVTYDTSHPELVRSLYVERIQEKISEIDLIILISSSPQEVPDEDFIVRFKHYNQVLYGVAREDYFRDVLHELTLRLRVVAKKHPFLGESIAEFLKTYCASAECALLPRVHFNRPQFDDSQVPLKDAVSIKNAFDRVLAKEGLSGDWQVVIDDTGKRKTVSVGYSTKRIYIPNNDHYLREGKRNALGAKALQKLIVHEIHTHVRRQVNGAKTNLQLLSLGLAECRLAEEGIATYREQELLAENDFFSGYLSYFSIGIALGLDRGNIPRNFKEVFQVLQQLFMLFYGKKEAVANRLAWDRCVRIYRGARGHLTGVVLHKDLLYRAGNIHIHGLKSQNPAIEKWFSAGRFDPGNKKQVEALLALGIITPL